MKRILQALFSIFFLGLSAHLFAQDTYSAFARQDYYTDEDNGQIVVFVPESKSALRITVDLAFEFDFLVRGQIAFPGHMVPVPFSTARLHQGDNEVTVSFYENEKWVDSRKVNVVVKALSPNEVKTDRLTGNLVADGLPFIPVGFYCSWPEGAVLPEQEVVRGFNLISPYWKIDKKGRKDRKKFMDRCAELGMKVNYNLCSVAGGGGNSSSRSEGLSRAEKMEMLKKEVESMRNHPALLAWYISDEPVGQGVPADSLKAAYDLIKELDPYHPVSIVFMAPNMAGEYKDVMDIAMTDPYPIPNGSILEVENFVKALQGSYQYDKPVWLVPQAFGGSEWWTREPNAKEVRAMTYLGIINGAAGIQYFIRKGPNGSPKSQATWGECGAIAQEVMELTPALVSGLPSPPVTISRPELRAKTYNQMGMFTILVVNTSAEPVPFDLKMGEVDLSMTGEVMFENRHVEIKEGSISDIIDGLGTRIYRFDNRSKVDWMKDFSPKNLVVDPGFENNAIPAIPASCYVKPGLDPGASCFLDGRVKEQGDHTLRLTTPIDGGGVTLSFYGLELDPEKSYTCSIWGMKAKDNRENKKDGQEFTLMLGKGKEEKGRRGAEETFFLSEKWEAYSFTSAGRNMQPSLGRWYSPQLRLDGQGTAWFDRLQVVPDMEMKNRRGEGEKGRMIELSSNHDGSSMFYTLDGTEPTLSSTPYKGPFNLEHSALVRAASFDGSRLTGAIQSGVTIHKASSARVSYITRYEKYTASGDNALLDGIRGTYNYKDGKWQGFHGEDAEFVINLGHIDTVNSVTISFLQDISVWIFLPSQLTISLSQDGTNYETMVILYSDVPPDQRGALIYPFNAQFDAVRAKFIKIQARNIGFCPEWHQGAGGKAWVFTDEVIVE